MEPIFHTKGATDMTEDPKTFREKWYAERVTRLMNDWKEDKIRRKNGDEKQNQSFRPEE